MHKDLGDFQTPPALVQEVLACPELVNRRWSRAIEPTCGQGNFIKGLLNVATPPCEIQAIEIQDRYLACVQRTILPSLSTHIVIKQANIFDLNLHKDLQWKEQGPLLVIGNPPWVTNAALGVLGSNNLPVKKNVKRLGGIAAQTGESNFDIAEYIWLKLVKDLQVEQPTIALLCKISVARNVLQFAIDTDLPIKNAFIRLIDAKKWFGAAVEACLFFVEIGQGKRWYEAPVYPDLSTLVPDSTIGIVNKQLVANMQRYQHVAATDGISPVMWRQGLKHDAASVMELIYDSSGCLLNKFGETVTVETQYLYPLLKSSDLFHGMDVTSKRMVIVTQTHPGENTLLLAQKAPHLWEYLMQHQHIFAQRKSSIYEKQPPFAIFGIGEYSFAPYKVGISGLHKIPRFQAIGPVNGRPVMLNDTCYFIPCSTPYETACLTSLLNDPACQNFIHSIIFLDAKRPVTKKLLQRIDLVALLKHIERQNFIVRVKKVLEQLGALADDQQCTWSDVEHFLVEYFQNGYHSTSAKANTDTMKQLTWI